MMHDMEDSSVSIPLVSQRKLTHNFWTSNVYLLHPGLNGKSSNFYIYVLNNPLVLKDPTGRIPLPLAGAIIGVGLHLLTTPLNQVSPGSKQ